MSQRLDGDIRGYRGLGLRKLYSNDWFDKAIGANALVEADIIDAQVLEESCRRDVLIVRALKVGRETVPREASRELG